MNIKVNVNETKLLGGFKPVNCGNMSPPIYCENAGQNIRKYYKEQYIPLVRNHDAALFNGGLRLVDIPMVFPLFHLDPSDPKNYYFTATDDYIDVAEECGSKVYYRLGVSIDHSYNKYNINPPEDYAKWADIATGIIRHYTEGWASETGKTHDIKYWEIWNEAEGISGEGRHLHTNWNAPYETFLDFYVTVSKILKERFPHLKIGGPALCGWGMDENNPAMLFLKRIVKEKAPLDFFSFHWYSNNPHEMVRFSYEAREMLDKFGYKDTEIHINEWQYLPDDGFSGMRENPAVAPARYREMQNSQAGAYEAAAMISFLDCPYDISMVYTTSTGHFGMYEADSFLPAKNYYSVKAIGQLFHFYPERVNAEVKTEMRENRSSVQAAAGIDDKNNLSIVIANYKNGASDFEVTFEKEYTNFEVMAVTDEHSLDNIPFTIDNGVLKFVCEFDSSTIWVKASK